MQKYRYLVLSDLDGTLLNSHGELSEETIAYVKELNRRNDILFCFSTGRCWRDAKEIYAKLELKGFASCCNGAYIYDPHQELIRYSFISEKFLNYFLHNKDFISGLMKGDVLTDKMHLPLTKDNATEVLNKIRELEANVYGIKNYYDYTQPIEDFNRLMVNRINALRSFDFPPNVTVFNYDNFLNMEIQASYVNKELVVDFLGNYYGVAPENILTFGDQVNDLSPAMGKSRFCAVSNAIDLIKQNATLVSKYSNDENAVIREIELFLRDKK
ncbi:hydrolase [Candidatus Mycoplasma haematobovis]|uniref:Hydrolase n=1 Tax=Candidatus Mycoplasma haematobovis TaxID=432608 RepID=A0A1A9QE40_9MOLU|nr:HAD-IIB family hydrolase [Candidatus Mycoplasma haematobovis]OAL10225.1 hydrolase [Candidatus Mycoplasma haematobovis]